MKTQHQVGPSYFEGRTNNNERSRTFFDHSHPQEVTWEAVKEMVTSNEKIRNYVEEARRCRAEGDKGGYDRYKQMGGAITPAACCRGGHKQADIVALTGCTLVDLDHISPEQMEAVRAKIWADPHTMMAWTTASGEGIRVIARYRGAEELDMRSYAQVWKVVNGYYSTLTGIEADTATKDPNRLSFISHDEQAAFNPEAERFEVSGSGCADAEWAMRTAMLWADRVTTYQEGSRHNYVVEVAKVLNKLGVSEPDAERMVEARFADLDDRATTLRSIYRNNVGKHGMLAGKATDAVGEAASGSKKAPTAGEYRRMILERWEIRHNSLSRQSEMRAKGQKEWRPITDKDLNTMAAVIGDQQGRMVMGKTISGVVNSDYFPTVSPLADFLASLPEWDGQDHVGALLEGIVLHQEEERELVGKYLRIWLRGMVAGWMGRSCNQLVLILLGAQGRGKSTFCRRLLPPELERYFLTQVNASRMDKDEQFALTENALICLDEFDTMFQRETNRLKSMITMENVKARAAYGMVPEVRKRTATYCGTGNNIQFLTDSTGNRRFLPVWVEKVDPEAAARIGHEQIYSQLKHELEQGMPYYVTTQESESMEEYLHQFMAVNVEEELLSQMLMAKEKARAPRFMTASFVAGFIAKNGCAKIDANKVGRLLSRMGYEKRSRHNINEYKVEFNPNYYGETI